MTVSEGANERYNALFQRNIGIYTSEMQDLLRRSCVAIGGVGGPGGIAAVTLARNGIGHIKIADPDVFEKHNINRQPAAFVSTLGKNKTLVLEQMLKDINPQICVTSYPEGITKSNLDNFLTDADVIIDAIDYSAPEEKLSLYQKARDKGLYVLSSPISGFGSLVFCFDPAGMTVEQAFSFPTDPALIATHKIPPEKLIGGAIDYVAPDFFQIVASGAYIPTNASACVLTGAAISVDALKILVIRDRHKCGADKYSHLGKIPLTTVPHATRYDVWYPKECRIVDTRTLG